MGNDPHIEPIRGHGSGERDQGLALFEKVDALTRRMSPGVDDSLSEPPSPRNQDDSDDVFVQPMNTCRATRTAPKQL